MSGQPRRKRGLWLFLGVRWLKDLLTQLLSDPAFISFLFLQDGRESSSCISWVLSSLLFFQPLPFSLFFSIFLYIKQLCQYLYCTLYSFPPPLSLPISAWPCSKCTYCPHFPWLPSSLSPEQSPAVQPKDLFTQGKKKQRLCYQQCRVNALYFNLGRNTTLFEDCLFCLRSDFQCCKKHKLLSVCQDLQPKRNYYYGVGTFFFFV